MIYIIVMALTIVGLWQLAEDLFGLWPGFIIGITIAFTFPWLTDTAWKHIVILHGRKNAKPQPQEEK